jgi:hypothetical protein
MPGTIVPASSDAGSQGKWLKWLRAFKKSGPWSVVLATIGRPIALVGICLPFLLALWTANKDFFEYCQGLQVRGRPLQGFSSIM